MRRNENFGRESWMAINRVFSFWHLSEKTLCSQSQHFSSRLLGLLNYRHEWRKPHCTFSLSQLKQCSFKPYAWVRILRENLILCVHSLNFYVFSAPVPGKIFSLPRLRPGPQKNQNPRPGLGPVPSRSLPRIYLEENAENNKKNRHTKCLKNQLQKRATGTCT